MNSLSVEVTNLSCRLQLRGELPLVEHCVEISGLVQLLLELKPGHPIRLNVVDIQLPERLDNNQTNTLGAASFVHPATDRVVPRQTSNKSGVSAFPVSNFYSKENYPCVCFLFC